MEHDKKYKKIITILLILLCISLVALIGTAIYKHFATKESTSVNVPENFITSEDDDNADKESEGTEENNNTGTDKDKSSNEGNITTGSHGNSNNSLNSNINDSFNNGANDSAENDSNIVTNDSSDNGPDSGTAGNSNDSSSNGTNNDSDNSTPTSTVISLHKGQFTDNEPFKVANMLPGDLEVRNFCLKVSYKNSAKINFSVDIPNQSAKLLEVLKLKVTLLNSGEVVYDGLMRDMGDLETYTLEQSDSAKTKELYYEISTYLDPSVGNEYMGSAELKADFKWMIDDKSNLVREPGKLDYANAALMLSLLTGSLLVLKLLPKKHNK